MKEKKKFKETAVGKFLSEKVPGVLDVVDDYFPPAKFLTALVGQKLTPEEQTQFESLLLEYEQTERKDYLADVQNSRETNVKIQESDSASWMAKNTGYMMDCFVSLIWACLTFYIAAKYLNIIKVSSVVNFDGIWGLYASVCTFMGTILNWHRGSSKGSDDKQKTMDKMMRK